VALEDVWRDSHVAALFVEDRLQRTHTHQLLKTVVAQIEDYIPTPVTRSEIDVVKNPIMPVTPGNKRVVLPGGRPVVVTQASRLVRPCIATCFNITDYLFLTHTVDRGPCNVAALHFMLSRPVLWSIMWGPLHDTWNAIKTAGKGVPTWWQEVVRFAAICNLNFGPFRTGAWGKAKQHSLKESSELHGPGHLRFRELAVKQMVLWGHVDMSDAGFKHAWKQYCTLRSAHAAGPVLKFSRWRSILECWDYHEPEIWLLKFLLEHLSPDTALAALAHGDRIEF
jgi:hypothetical protein